MLLFQRILQMIFYLQEDDLIKFIFLHITTFSLLLDKKITPFQMFAINKEPILSLFVKIYRLCVCATGSFMIDIFSCSTLIRVSCRHFGQYRG